MKIAVVVDMQNDFLTGPLGNEMCRAAIPGVVDMLKNNRFDRVFLTRDTHYDNYLSTLEGRKLPVPHCKFNTQGWNIDETVMNVVREQWQRQGAGDSPTDTSNYYIIDKLTFGSYSLATSIKGEVHRFVATRVKDEANRFYEDSSNDTISHDSDLEIHVCGVCTSICVLANTVILRAAFPDAKIVVHKDACGDVTQEMHDAALVCFKSQQCEVV